MDLISVTPTNKARFALVNPATGEAIKTDKDNAMFVSVFGAHSKEYQSALLEKHRRTIAILKSHDLKDGDDITEKAKLDLQDNETQLMCDITSSILFQASGEECRSKKEFYKNEAFGPWFLEIAKFTADKANFIKA